MKYLFCLIVISGMLSPTISYSDTEYEDLDGVFIKAVDNYPALKKNEFAIGATFLPFDPYFYGIGISLAYSRYFNKKWGWEVLSGNFLFGIQTPLADEILEETAKAGNPIESEDLEQTEFMVNTNLKYVLSYGKNIFFDKYIRLNRTELLFGLGVIGTSGQIDTGGGSGQTYIAANLGFQLDFSITKTMSWKLEYMNHINLERSGVGNNFLEFGEFKGMLAWRF